MPYKYPIMIMIKNSDRTLEGISTPISTSIFCSFDCNKFHQNIAMSILSKHCNKFSSKYCDKFSSRYCNKFSSRYCNKFSSRYCNEYFIKTL
jgi:hypothetical protein